MNEVKKVSLSVSGNTIVIEPDPVTLMDGDQIVFVAEDSNTYTVIIPADAHNLASEYFNTSRSIIISDITGDGSILTPQPVDNIDTGSNGIAYTVIATTSTNAFSNDPDAPPKIIIRTT